MQPFITSFPFFHFKFIPVQAVDFVNDGYFPPYIGEEFESLIKENKGKVNSGLKLRKILVEPTRCGEDAKVSRVVCEKTDTNELVSYRVKSLYLSLGPSNLAVNVIPPKMDNGIGVLDRLGQTLLGNRETNLLNPMMWAAGASMVFMVKVDEDVVGVEEMRRFRDHIDGHNKHVVRLGEKLLRVDGEKTYRVFAFQVKACEKRNDAMLTF